MSADYKRKVTCKSGEGLAALMMTSKAGEGL